MNIFILSTGRSGTTTFIKACSHIKNFSSGHETRCGELGPDRLGYPENHIEADNRLAWFLGRLDEAYGDQAFYVHLTRDPAEVAVSYSKRTGRGLLLASYAEGIYLHREAKQLTYIETAQDLVHTINSNIKHFLKDKTHQMHIDLSNAKTDFPVFWKKIGAKGSLKTALTEWDIRHNASK